MTSPEGSGMVLRTTRSMTNSRRSPTPADAPESELILPVGTLIPRPHEWEVVLSAHSGNIVRYNPDRQQFIPSVQEERDGPSATRLCPCCHRPMPQGMSPSWGDTTSYEDVMGGSNRSSEADRSVPSYFRLLANAFSTSSTPRPSSPVEEETAPGESGEGAQGVRPGLSSHSFNQGYYARFFREERSLGRGYRGSVFLCRHILDSVELGQYAIKKVAVGDNHSWLVRMLREIDLLERLRHRHVIEYKHVWIESHKLSRFAPAVPCLFILMEFANGGDLEGLIEARWEGKAVHPAALAQPRKGSMGSGRSGQLLSLPEVEGFMRDICAGLSHLHQHGVIHRDLKPGNVLLSYDLSRPDVRPCAMLTDFGEGVIASTGVKPPTGRSVGEGVIENTLGTPEYMPPELLVDVSSSPSRSSSLATPQIITPSVDLWSLGMTFHFLCFSRLPWSQVEDVEALIQEIMAFPGWEDAVIPETESRTIPIGWSSILRGLAALDPSQRMSIEDVLRLLDPYASVAMESDGTTFGSGGVLERRRSLLPPPEMMEASKPLWKRTSEVLQGRPRLFFLTLVFSLLVYANCYPMEPTTTAMAIGSIVYFANYGESEMAAIGATILLLLLGRWLAPSITCSSE